MVAYVYGRGVVAAYMSRSALSKDFWVWRQQELYVRPGGGFSGESIPGAYRVLEPKIAKFENTKQVASILSLWAVSVVCATVLNVIAHPARVQDKTIGEFERADAETIATRRCRRRRARAMTGLR